MGVDLLDLGDGTVAAVTTGFNDGTFTITVINGTTGAVVTNTTAAVPAGILSPAHAAWIGDDRQIVISGFGSDNYAVTDSGL